MTTILHNQELDLITNCWWQHCCYDADDYLPWYIFPIWDRHFLPWQTIPMLFGRCLYYTQTAVIRIWIYNV